MASTISAMPDASRATAKLPQTTNNNERPGPVSGFFIEHAPVIKCTDIHLKFKYQKSIANHPKGKPMFKVISKSVNVMALTVLMVSSVTSLAHADRGQVVRLNSQGFKICKAMDYDGVPGWTAKVNGQLLDGGYGGTGYRFRVHTCFTSQARCANFVANIEHYVDGVDKITSRRCYRR